MMERKVGKERTASELKILLLVGTVTDEQQNRRPEPSVLCCGQSASFMEAGESG